MEAGTSPDRARAVDEIHGTECHDIQGVCSDSDSSSISAPEKIFFERYKRSKNACAAIVTNFLILWKVFLKFCNFGKV